MELTQQNKKVIQKLQKIHKLHLEVTVNKVTIAILIIMIKVIKLDNYNLKSINYKIKTKS